MERYLAIAGVLGIGFATILFSGLYGMSVQTDVLIERCDKMGQVMLSGKVYECHRK